MPVHIFVTNRENFEICIRRGLAAVPGGTKPDIRDQLISRMVMIAPSDRILFYITGEGVIHGVYEAVDRAFYDETPVWPARENGENYPLRVRIQNSQHVFQRPVSLSDIYDLRDHGKIWTFALRRATNTTNAMFAISEIEFEEVLRLFLQANYTISRPEHIREPYRHIEPDLIGRVSLDESGQPKYESSLASRFLASLSQREHRAIFGDYSDYLAYVPTTFQREIDAVLFHSLPGEKRVVVAHTVIELKRDVFKDDGLSQLLRYEDWFLKKRAAGDSRAIRTVAIARGFHPNVVSYLERRELLEGKTVTLLRYDLASAGLSLTPVGHLPT
jgi:hypothetical protein